jgi:hypothetical protein
MWSGWKRSMLKGRVVLKEWDEMEKKVNYIECVGSRIWYLLRNGHSAI